MTPPVLAALVCVAVLSAVISAITGVAGGVILLSAFLVTLPPLAVVPVHGAVQLIANASRLMAFWSHIRWPVVLRFALMSLPGAALGATLVASLSPRALQIAIAIAVLWTLVSNRRQPMEVSAGRLRWFYPLGLLCGVLGMVVGSTGPVITQALLWAGVVKEEHVATKAACQALGNIIKIVFYGTTLGFAFGDHGLLIAIMGAGSIVGTYLGRQLLRRVSETGFVTATRVLLAAVAIKILVGV